MQCKHKFTRRSDHGRRDELAEIDDDSRRDRSIVYNGESGHSHGVEPLIASFHSSNNIVVTDARHTRLCILQHQTQTQTDINTTTTRKQLECTRCLSPWCCGLAFSFTCWCVAMEWMNEMGSTTLCLSPHMVTCTTSPTN